MATVETPRRRRRAWLGVVVGLLVPVAVLVLLLRRPVLDLRWEHHPAHFWLVLSTAAVAAILAYATGDAAARRGDARLTHVSLALLSSAGFLFLHALATPGILLPSANVGFTVATPVGVTLGSLFALRSTRVVAGEAALREVRLARRLRWGLIAVMVLWGVLSVAELPPFRAPAPAEALPVGVAVVGIVLYGVAAWRYAKLWWKRGDLVLLAVFMACLLLAEALLAMALARNWHLSWWEWHLLLLLAFGLVAAGARHSWHEERFSALYLDDTRSGQREVTVLFADLQGFTSWSERNGADRVTAMLNDYFAEAVPAVVDEGGTVEQIIGDALMVTFNTKGDQPDHAQQAVRAGLALQEATAAVAEEHPEWPRFRVGVNTGPVSRGLLGTAGGRTHTVIGDTVNTASRIEGQAPAGGVAVGPATLAALTGAVTTPLGSLSLKGKAEPVELSLVLSLSANGGG